MEPTSSANQFSAVNLNGNGKKNEDEISIDIFTGKKYDHVFPSTHNMMVSNVERKEYALIDVTDDGFTSLLDEDNNEMRQDIKLPEGDLGKEIRDKLQSDETLRVTVIKTMSEEAIVSYEVDKN